MDTNPYTPPGTPLEDAPAASPSRLPRALQWAIALLWVGFAISAITFSVRLVAVSLDATATALAALTVGIYAAWAYAILQLSKARRWARNGIVVLAVIGIVGALTALSPTVAWVIKARWLFLSILYAAALVLLLRPASRAWFRK